MRGWDRNAPPSYECPRPDLVWGECCIDFDAVPCDDRWVLVERETGELLDTAMGHGYRSKQSAEKAGWYKYRGGKRVLVVREYKKMCEELGENKAAYNMGVHDFAEALLSWVGDHTDYTAEGGEPVVSALDLREVLERAFGYAKSGVLVAQ